MIFHPHAYQQHCIDAIVAMSALGLFLDMGLGKTVIALSAIRILRYDRFQIRKALVIAPKKVAEGTWIQEKDKWDHTKILRVMPVLGSEQKRIRALETPADVYVINRENVVWLVEHFRNAWPFDMVVIDESSSFKSYKAKRFKALAAIRQHISRIVLLTGTPSPNSLADLWSQMYLIDGGERLERRYAQFRERYFDVGYRNQAGIVFRYTAKPGAGEAILRKISDVCISLKAEDYLALPEIIYDDVPVVLDPQAAKQYREMERRMVLELPEDEEVIDVTSAAALSNKLLQLSNGAIYDEEHAVHEIHRCKIDAFAELVEALLDRGKSALVFYNYQHDRDRILECLSGNARVAMLEGPDTIERWNRKEIDILLAHPASAAYGLNLQEGGHHVIWFGLTWNYEQYVQANARLHRQGQAEPVIVHHLVSEGTRDQDVIKALQRKGDSQEYVLQSLKARIRAIREGAA